MDFFRKTVTEKVTVTVTVAQVTITETVTGTPGLVEDAVEEVGFSLRRIAILVASIIGLILAAYIGYGLFIAFTVMQNQVGKRLKDNRFIKVNDDGVKVKLRQKTSDEKLSRARGIAKKFFPEYYEDEKKD